MKRIGKKILAVSMILSLTGVVWLSATGKKEIVPEIKAQTTEQETVHEETVETEPVFHYEIVDQKKKTIAVTKIDFVGESLSIPKKIDGYTVVRVGSRKGKYYTPKECRKSKYKSLYNYVNYAMRAFFYTQISKKDFPEKDRKLHVLSNEAGIKLKHLELPETVKTIGGLAFQNCPLIEEINLPEGVEYIHAGAFQYNEKAKDLVIPKSVKKIGACAFDTSYLQKVVIKSSKVIIGTRAFSQHMRVEQACLKKIIMPERIKAKQLKKWCFMDYQGTSFVWPDCSGKNITTDWFDNCKTIKHLKISKYAKKVVFGRCVISGDVVRQVTIPARVKKVVVKQQPTTFYKFIFRGKNTRLVGEPKMGANPKKNYISVAKVIAPRNAKAFQYAKNAKYPVRFYADGGYAHWAMDPMNYYTEYGVSMKKVKCVVYK